MEGRIKYLEQQQRTLEINIGKHKGDIQQFKSDFQSNPTQPEIKADPSKNLPPDPTSTLKKLEESKKSAQPKMHKKPEQAPKPKPIKATPKKRDLHKIEQDLGKIWFVRLGIISLLTGLIFLSNFAYKNFIMEWGAGPRLAGMYFLSVVLLGLGTYFEKAKTALSNYGKVLAAGGIATLYYTSYAAHHIDRLKVIDSPLIAGILLITSAAICLIYALWKRSNITAICSIALAYYSISINPVGAFSLVSSLILTLTGAILLHRLRSASIGFVSMLGAYLSFIFWQAFVNQEMSNYEHTSWFIVGYWLLSTVSILIPRDAQNQTFSKSQLLSFTSINNAFLILLMSIDFQTLNWVEPLWHVSAVIAFVFILISLSLQFGEKILPNIANISHRSSLHSLFMIKGVALITLALCLKLTGPSLALSLTIQAGLLLIASRSKEQKMKICFNVSYLLILLLGFGIYIVSIQDNSSPLTLTHLIMTALYLGVSLIAHFKVIPEDRDNTPLRGIPAIFAIISLSLCIGFSSIPAIQKVTLYLLLNIGLTTYYFLSNKKNVLPEFCLGSHLFPLIAITIIASNLNSFSLANFVFITLMAVASAAINTCIHTMRDRTQNLYIFYVITATVSIIITLITTNSITSIMTIGSLIPLAYHFIHQKFIQYKLLPILIIGLIVYPLIWFFYLVSYIDYFYPPNSGIQIIVAFSPVIHLLLIKNNILTSIKGLSTILTIATAIMLAIWQLIYISSCPLTLAITAAAYHVLDRKENRLLTMIAVLYYFGSISLTLQSYNLTTTTIEIYTISCIPLASYFARKILLTSSSETLSDYYLKTQKFLAILSSITIWGISSLHLTEVYGNAALSIVWAIVALSILCIGFLSKDIVFRTMSFIILGCTVIHVFGVDVWKLNALLRILSFITLGIILLLIGYIYCRKSDQTEEIVKPED